MFRDNDSMIWTSNYYRKQIRLHTTSLVCPIKMSTKKFASILIDFSCFRFTSKQVRAKRQTQAGSKKGDQSPLEAYMIIWYQWDRYVMYVVDLCYMLEHLSRYSSTDEIWIPDTQTGFLRTKTCLLLRWASAFLIKSQNNKK